MEATTRVMVVDLPDPLEALPADEVACHNDMLSIGMQPGEAEALPIRVVATVITASIMSAWCDRSKTQRKLLFFAHWSSGLVYLLSEWVMAMMILACWSNHDVSWFIKMWKFIELTADNMLAATNLAICLQLSLIVSSAYSVTPVRTLGSNKVVMLMLAISALIPATALPLWQEELVTTGTQYWLNSSSMRPTDVWVTISQFLPELCVAIAMLFMVVALLATRRSELRKCWKAHWRIKYYFGLTCIAIAVNFAIGVGGLLWIVWKRDSLLIVAGWSMRHVHIALDTLLLYGVLVKHSERDEKISMVGMEENLEAATGRAIELSNSSPATFTFNDTRNSKAAAPKSEFDVGVGIGGAHKVSYADEQNDNASTCGSGGGVSINCECVSCVDGMRRIWPALKGEKKEDEAVVNFPRDSPALLPGDFAKQPPTVHPPR